ncbi:DUF6688 family protein [Chondromyces crocatus]|uniref:DUF6688 domain-containing protein n=1 Tax=Chondromyces crocatus TaxID=52 RepID=A0A0K1EHE3_CHOCO|nr:DUF6688 family protein [Chondromyces crocatus]AKT40274.1 uncharacterized protein CMC5_044270 [Chondromyces crocatus]
MSTSAGAASADGEASGSTEQDEHQRRSENRPDMDALLSMLLIVGYAAPLVFLGSLLFVRTVNLGMPMTLLAVIGLCAGMVLVFLLHAHTREHGRRALRIAAEFLALGVLPTEVALYSHVAKSSCVVTSCELDAPVLRPFAEPEAVGLVPLHAVVVLLYVISRRRPGVLHAPMELLVHAGLLVGMMEHGVLAVQLWGWAQVTMLFPPLLLLLALAPVQTTLFLGEELRARLRRRGAEAQRRARVSAAASVYRAEGPQEEFPRSPRMHWPALVRALGASPLLLGVYAMLHAAWLGRADGALRMFTRTCHHTLSQIPLETVPAECHYLCTVAARGHTWLVKPLRMGRRGGAPIVVNRQLAVANAFEDLLHTRWPRFGRMARRIYDRLGLPVSRYLRPRWASDLTYLAMKPAEWMFYVALLLLDPGPPEARIDRMYR